MHYTETDDRVRMGEVKQECEKVIEKFHRDCKSLKSSKNGEVTNLLQQLLNQSMSYVQADTSEDEDITSRRHVSDSDDSSSMDDSD